MYHVWNEKIKVKIRLSQKVGIILFFEKIANGDKKIARLIKTNLLIKNLLK